MLFLANLQRACIDKILLLIHLFRISRLANFYEFVKEVLQRARDGSVGYNYVNLVSLSLSFFCSSSHTPTHNLIPCFRLTE